MIVTESLRKKHMEAVKKAREDHGFENVWSSEGKILNKDVSKGKKIKVYLIKKYTSRRYWGQSMERNSCVYLLLIDLCFCLIMFWGFSWVNATLYFFSDHATLI